MAGCPKCDWDEYKKDNPGGRYVSFAECKAKICPMRDRKTQVEWKPSDLPPGPYSYEINTAKGNLTGNGFVYLLDANGRKIASMWAKPAEKLALANFICDAMDLTIKGTK